MDPQARKDLVFTVAFALGCCRTWLREMIKPHNSDEARMQAAEAIVRQIEQSNFRVEQVPPRPPQLADHLQILLALGLVVRR